MEYNDLIDLIQGWTTFLDWLDLLARLGFWQQYSSSIMVHVDYKVILAHFADQPYLSNLIAITHNQLTTHPTNHDYNIDRATRTSEKEAVYTYI